MNALPLNTSSLIASRAWCADLWATSKPIGRVSTLGARAASHCGIWLEGLIKILERQNMTHPGKQTKRMAAKRWTQAGLASQFTPGLFLENNTPQNFYSTLWTGRPMGVMGVWTLSTPTPGGLGGYYISLISLLYILHYWAVLTRANNSKWWLFHLHLVSYYFKA